MESTNSLLGLFQQLDLQQKLLLLNQIKSLDRGRRDTRFFAEYWLGLSLNPFQIRACEKIDDLMWGGQYAPQDLIELLLHAGNRSGKTVLLCVLHIKFAFYKFGIQPGPGYEEFKYRSFDISPISRQAKECLKGIETILEGRFTWEVEGKRFLNRDGLKLRNFYEGKNENIGELRYRNGSITYAFSTGSDMGTGFQGLPSGFVSYDEAPLSHHLEDELDSNVYSRLGDYGRLVMLVGTPNEEGHSQQYFFHLTQEAKAGENKYTILGGSYLENIFISEKKRESHKATLLERDPVMARQILYGDFVTTGGNLFDAGVIERLWNGQKQSIEPQESGEYIVTIDWGMAEGGDETVMLVWRIDRLPVEIVYAYAKKGGDPYELMGVLRNLLADYNNALPIMDTGGLGGVIMKKLMRDLKPIAFDASGTGETKQNALTYAKILMTKGRKKRMVDGMEIDDNPDFGWIRSFYLPRLANQLATYKLDDRNIKQDWVSAFYMGTWWIWKKFGDKEHKQKTYSINRFKVRVPMLNKNL